MIKLLSFILLITLAACSSNSRNPAMDDEEVILVPRADLETIIEKIKNNNDLMMQKKTKQVTQYFICDDGDGKYYWALPKNYNGPIPPIGCEEI